MRTAASGSIVIATLLLGAAVARATESPNTDWPLERIVSNLEQLLVASPDEARVHYQLGRAHGFSFALERSSLWTIDTRVGPFVKDLNYQRLVNKSASTKRRVSNQPLDLPPPTPEGLLVHLTQGVQHLARALELAELHSTDYLEDNAKIELCLAWLLERGAHLASRVDTKTLFDPGVVDVSAADVAELERALGELREGPDQKPRHDLQPSLLAKLARYCSERNVSADAPTQAAIDALLAHYWREQAITHYRSVVERSLARMRTVCDENRMILVREARESLMRLVQAGGYLDDAEREGLVALDARMAEVEALENRTYGVSPILLSIDGCKSLDELIAPDLHVPFDLDGDAVDELWPWLAPGTGWLVWDPSGKGEITSGLQLFGSASAWLFFEDGYRVLDALDDDRSGALRGPELTGIAVWFDRDTDGVSDRGEVVPVEELGIVALATESTITFERSPANLCGLELADGRALPTYDWVLAPAEP